MMFNVRRILSIPFTAAALALPLVLVGSSPGGAQSSVIYKYNDSHFHLTNYMQEGTSVKDYMAMMGNVVKRSTLFSFSDASVATAYKALPSWHQIRLDPMITAFSPAGMHAPDHIKRVLMTSPGVFTGIGEFSIHKPSKVAGSVATPPDPALHGILDFAGEAGLVVILQNDIEPDQDPSVLMQFKELLLKHPNTAIIWAHAGLGRSDRLAKDHFAIIENVLANPALKHVNIDISGDETAKHVTASPETVAATAALIEKFPDRFLFGSDVVAPAKIDSQMAVFDAYEPLRKALRTPTARKVALENYERIFDEGRRRVRAWETANVK
jgi:hypothetical protein